MNFSWIVPIGENETAKQIEDAKSGKFTELDSDTQQEKAREIKPNKVRRIDTTSTELLL